MSMAVLVLIFKGVGVEEAMEDSAAV